MKYLISLSIIILVSINSESILAQSFRGLDKSPMDVAYLPDNFAHDRDPGQKAIVKVYYSRPQKKGRDIFGSKVPYGQVWRTGANEAVELKAYQDITLNGKTLKAGTYSLFTIPNKDDWELIISNDLDYWGAYSYDKSKDVLRFKVPTKTAAVSIEAFSIRFEAQGDAAAVMRMGWDTTFVEVPVKY